MGKMHILQLWDSTRGGYIPVHIRMHVQQYSLSFVAAMWKEMEWPSCVGGEVCLRASWCGGSLVEAGSQQLAGVSIRENVRECQIFLGMYWNSTEGFLSLTHPCVRPSE